MTFDCFALCGLSLTFCLSSVVINTCLQQSSNYNLTTALCLLLQFLTFSQIYAYFLHKNNVIDIFLFFCNILRVLILSYS